MDSYLSHYIIRYYHDFLTPLEKRAHRHLSATTKITHGASDSAAQQQAWDAKPHLRDVLSYDPEVLLLTAAGMEQFVKRAAERVFAEHGDKIILNNCPKCGALAKTPKARQCRLCHHDWHT
ncbi:MAG TPA: hypothetical protein VGI16_10080 [Candidatus Acidoferrum sp.]|jgi:ribosomal protein L40E